MNIIYMGTPEFAAASLKALIESGENVQAVFSQPDKPKGRGNKITPPPVKVCALENNIPVYQPASLKKGEEAEDAYKKIKELSPDLIVVAAYGKILPKSILDIPKHGCINVHASLLPKYRGAGPIQWCILKGEHETGITTMLMAEGLDTGDMLIKRSVEIGEDETADELHDRLAVLGAETLLETIEGIKNGTLTPEKQQEELSCYAPMLTRDLSPIDFNKPAQEIHNLIRGLSSWPCASAEIGGKKLKIYKSTLDRIHHNGAPGEVCDKKNFTVICGDGYGITFLEIQAEGGKRMKAADFLRGNRLFG